MGATLAQELGGLPDAVARYLRHALGDAPDAVPTAVRLRMRGEIKLRDRWWPFRATEWLAPQRGFVWRATVRMGLLWISGSDRYSATTADAGETGSMRWRLLGLFPVMSASGPEIGRSARGRCAGEATWAPGALLPRHGVHWRDLGDDWLSATIPLGSAAAPVGDSAIGDHATEIVRLRTDAAGRVQAIRLDRWGNPDDTRWRLEPFGATVEAEATFNGMTIPSRLRAGWWPDSDRSAEGEFFRVTLDAAEPA